MNILQRRAGKQTLLRDLQALAVVASVDDLNAEAGDVRGGIPTCGPKDGRGCFGVQVFRV